MRLMLYVIFLFASFAAFAQTKHIILDIDTVLVRQIPKKYKSKYAASSLITSSDSKLYHKMPHAEEAILRLQREPSVILHFVTTETIKWAESILKGFNLTKPYTGTVLDLLGTQSLNKIFSTSSAIDLNKITTDTENVLIVSNNDIYFNDETKSHQIKLPENFYYFNTYTEAQSEISNLQSNGYYDTHKDFLPKSEDEWTNEHFKIANLTYRFIKAELFNTSNAKTLVKTLNNHINEVSFTKTGLQLASNSFDPKVLKWVINKNEWVTGCQQYDLILDRNEGSVTLKKCLETLPTSTKLIFNESQYKVTGCYLVTSENNAYIREEAADKCIQQASSIDYYWYKNQCGQFINDYFFYKYVDKRQCSIFLYELNSGVPEISISFNRVQDVKVIPEIMKLASGDYIPYDVYQTNTSENIATSLIIRKHKNYEAKDVKNSYYDFFNDTQNMMAFDSKYISSIIQNGFLNQHRTSKSKGYYGPQRRAKLEDKMIGVKVESSYNAIGKKAHDVRPKYSFLVLNKPEKMQKTHMYSQYGNVFAVMKDKVKLRATFTSSDSLNNDVTAKQTLTFFWKSSSQLKMIDPSEYYETQIWGELLVKRDVDKFIVNCPHVSNLTSSQIGQLKNTGIPVYSCKIKYNGSYPYIIYADQKL